MAVELRLFTPSVRSFSEVGLLYGAHIDAGRALVILRAGSSLYWYQEDDFGDRPRPRVGPRVGVPVEFQVVGSLGKNLGAGLGLLGDVNRTRSMWGVVFSINLGDTR